MYFDGRDLFMVRRIEIFKHAGTGVLLFCIAALTPIRQAYAQDPTFNKLTTNNGLSHNTVYTITQDKKGFMWFGTREGLNRYVGNTVVTFYADPDDSTRLTSNIITALEVGDDGLLYIGTPQGLHLYNDSQGIFKRISYKKAQAGYIRKILRAADGTLFIC